MGYTHYWERPASLPKRKWKEYLAQAKRIIAAAEVPLANGMGDAGTVPEVDDELVLLNGAGDDAHEGICIDRIAGDAECARCGKPLYEHAQSKCLFDHSTFKPKRSRERSFCKTARKPYDEVVCALLLEARRVFGDKFKVSSDGTWDEWAPGAAFYEKVTNRKAEPPWAVYTCTACGASTDDGHTHLKAGDTVKCYRCMTEAEHARQREERRKRAA